jgi:hypothetical protein
MKKKYTIERCPKEDGSHNCEEDAKMMSQKIMSLKDLKEDSHVAGNIIWDYEPKRLMEPVCRTTKEGKPVKKSQCYIFYIETMDEKPGLFLMVVKSSGYAETIAHIEEIPGEMLSEAIQENKDKEYFSMYPINKKIEGWLKKEFGIQE